MFRNTFAITFLSLILSACVGGLSGLGNSASSGHYVVYKVTYPDDGRVLTESMESILEEQFFSQGFRQNNQWRRLWFKNAIVGSFKQKRRGQYIRFDVEVSEDLIILMTAASPEINKNVFDTLESGLKEQFGETSVEKCEGVRDLNGHSCFVSYSG